MGESQGAVESGGGQEGQEADEDDAWEEDQGGDEHGCLQLATFILSKRLKDGRCEDGEGRFLIVLNHNFNAPLEEVHNRDRYDVDGDWDEGVESEEGSHKGH